MEVETAPATEKRLKKQKIKPPNPRKALFPRILAVFHCINFGVAMFIGTTKLIQFNDAPPNAPPKTKISGLETDYSGPEKIFFLY